MQHPLLISIVDDDEAVRSALEGLFLSSGYNATTFASAEAFLSSPESEASDCVVSDIQMPQVNGFDLSQALKKRQVMTPVILMSAYATDTTRAIADKAGAFCVLEKPFEPDILIDRVRAATTRDLAAFNGM